MESTLSLSKGVFAFKNCKFKSTSSKKLDKRFSKFQYWRLEEGRNDIVIQKYTSQNFYTLWSMTSGIIKDLLDNTHTVVLEELIEYIKNAGSAYHICSGTLHFKKDIPTACLITGVNMPDHESLFDILTKSIKETITPYVARLTSCHCSDIKESIYRMVNCFINGNKTELFDSDDEELVDKSPKKECLKKRQCNMSTLSTWYQTESSYGEGNIEPPKKKQKRNSGSPKKKPKQSKKRVPPLVVIIEDAEGMPPSVLQDLILICSEYHKNLPFIFILGVSTLPSAVHRSINQDANSSISMETFQAQPSTLLLSELIEKVLMGSLPFHFGGRVFKLLLDIFLFHDLSVNNFISALKHFLRGEVSFLCCDRKSRQRMMKCLPSQCLHSLRKVPSFIEYLKSLPEEKQKELNDEECFKKMLLEKLVDLEDWYQAFCIAVRSLHKLAYDLPGAPLGKQIREVFCTCLNQKVTETEEFQESWKLLGLSGKEELLSKLRDVCSIFEGLHNAVTENVYQKLKKHCLDLETFQDHPQEAPSPNSPSTKKQSAVELKPSDRFHLREKLLGTVKPKTKNYYEVLRSEILSEFEHFFISVLMPPQTKPFHEVIFFDSIGNIKYQLLGCIRATVTTGLTNPQKYFQCDCCRSEDSENSLLPTFPDVSICYKLHLECGRLINLYDWLEAFVATVDVDGTQCGEEFLVEKGKPKLKKRNIDPKLQARFTQAVSELQLLGFIKPTKRKTDHVERLTWGCC